MLFVLSLGGRACLLRLFGCCVQRCGFCIELCQLRLEKGIALLDAAEAYSMSLLCIQRRHARAIALKRRTMRFELLHYTRMLVRLCLQLALALSHGGT